MDDIVKALSILAMILIVVLVIGLMLVGLGLGGLLLVVVMLTVYGWILFAFLHYRYCRRDELLHLLANTAEAEVPLAPALEAYLQDRPRGNMREFWLATLLFFVLPGYYWIWHRRHSFDRRVQNLAVLLEHGVPLHQAFLATPGVASREAMLAAAIGHSTGQLGPCLRTATKRRLNTVWLELLPQIVYPFVMLLVIGSIVGFMVVFIVPKFQKIFSDFGVTLPPATAQLVHAADIVIHNWDVAILVVLLFTVAGLLILFSSTVRWHCPGFGTVYRRNVRSRVLQMLSMLLETGKGVPESLKLLATLPLGNAVLARLAAARYRAENGESLAESLLDAGLLSASMVPFVHAAERAGNLPWALAELADGLYERTIRAIQRIMQAVFPLSVVLVGTVVGVIVVCFFLPLVRLITELSR